MIHNAKAMVVTALWGTSVVVPAVVGVLLFVFGAFVQKLLGALFLALALLSSFLLTCCWGQWIQARRAGDAPKPHPALSTPRSAQARAPAPFQRPERAADALFLLHPPHDNPLLPPTRTGPQMLSDLLSVSGRALGANANLITVSLCIKFALLTLWGLVVFLIVAASSHGTITQNPYAIPNPAGGDSCIQTAPSGGAMGGASSSEGPSTVSCCSWAMTGDAIAYIVFAALFMLWRAARRAAPLESLFPSLLRDPAEMVAAAAAAVVAASAPLACQACRCSNASRLPAPLSLSVSPLCPRSGAIAFEMRLFMVAHVTARWYFLPAVRPRPAPSPRPDPGPGPPRCHAAATPHASGTTGRPASP